MIFKEKNNPVKPWQLVVLGLVIVSAVFFRWYYNRWQSGAVLVAGKTLPVLVAKTPSQQYEGWSSKDSMGTYEGMVFPFGSSDTYTFVMRQMRFPLDIIWVDDGTIVDIAPNLEPDPGKTDADLVEYRPRLPANFVLEVPAGFSEFNHVHVGDKVVFSYR